MINNTNQETPKTIIYNAHAHCFTIDHVPDYFAKGYLPVKLSWIRNLGFINWLIRHLPKILRGKNDMLDRLSNLLKYTELRNQEGKITQEKIVQQLSYYYPKDSKFVLLTMDMEYMDAGLPPIKFKEQLAELASIKRNPNYKERIFPFLFLDPRRISPIAGTKEDFVGEEFVLQVKEYMSSGIYQGFKLYPPIGYYPFDKNLKELYQFAVQNNIPITSHCITGVVHYRGENKPEWMTHPYTGEYAPGKKAKEYANNLAHPLNYECLLNKDILRKLWNDETVDLSELKICLGHFGGEDEWVDFMENPWLPDKGLIGDDSDINTKYNWFKKEGFEKLSEAEKLRCTPFSWFSICCDLIKKYNNVYADISYTLSEPKMFPLLKVVLGNNKRIREHTLFGSDFYVVSKAGAERDLCLQLRGYLGEDLFRQIAERNPREFLKNDFNSNV